MKNNLVLSLFPGIDGLGLGFKRQGYQIVWGPDLLWGWDIRDFHPPAGVFEGVIGGPPCQALSRMRYLLEACGKKPRHENRIPEFERVIAEARPGWYLMECVPEAEPPLVLGYESRDLILSPRWLGEQQSRERRFTFGTVDGRRLELDGLAVFESPIYEYAVTGDSRRVPVKLLKNGKPKRITVMAGDTPTSGQRDNGAGYLTLQQKCELQGLPIDYAAKESPFRKDKLHEMVGNAVPVMMAEAIAKAVRKATGNPVSASKDKGE